MEDKKLNKPIKHSEYLPLMIGFIESIGFEVIRKQLSDKTFLPGLDLGPSCIYIDDEKLKYPGDILHEAGHLAVATSQQRNNIGSADLVLPWPTDGEEIATLLWTYAAAIELKLPLDVVFHENGYKGQAQWLIEQFQSGQFLGLPLLQWMGLCLDEQNAKTQNLPAFPTMLKWVRDN